MKKLNIYLSLLAALLFASPAFLLSQEVVPSGEMVDVVLLNDGSQLTGHIVQWDIDRGMEFQLITGAKVMLSKADIRKVTQQQLLGEILPMLTQRQRLEKPYRFRETGLYQSFSMFLNTSFLGGMGAHYSIGHRVNRMLGIGVGLGIESNEVGAWRAVVPLTLEARGFFKPAKISPYYAIKAGYGFAVQDGEFSFAKATGGLHLSPELGLRFGSGQVCPYFGVQYKIQKASYLYSWNPDEFRNDQITYRRMDFRFGILF